MTDDECDGDIEELQETVQQLESAVSDLSDALEQERIYRKEVLKPRLEAMESESDDARAERAELGETDEELRREVSQLRSIVDSVAGLADGQATNPAKRVADLRQALIRQADSEDDDLEDGRAAMWWKEVQNLFAHLNHGQVSKPDCFKALHEAAEAQGFHEGTKLNENGNEVTAIVVKTDELPGREVSRNPTTRTAPADQKNGGESAESAASD